MRALLDTNALLWWLAGSRRLSVKAREYISNDEKAILVSAASAWEIATKWRIGKLPEADSLIGALGAICESQGFKPLSITLAHAERAGMLPGPHKDPFDRILAAQAHAEAIPIITNDHAFPTFGVRVLW